MFCVEPFSLLFAQVQHFAANNFEASAFKAVENGTDNIFATAFGLTIENVRSIVM